MKKETKYVHFPVRLLPSIILDTDATIEQAISYGVYRYARTIKAEVNEACRQIIYCYYREPDTLPIELFRKMETYINEGCIEIDENYFGFTGDTFNPEYEINDLMKIIQKDKEFREDILEFHRVRQALWFFDLTEALAIQLVIEVGKSIHKKIQQKEPIVSANLDVLKGFYRNDSKDENDKIQLVGFLAIKSILGEKDCVKTNKKLILCRMMGCRSYSEIEPDELNDSLAYLFERFSHRYHMDNLITMLELDWHLIAYSNKVRGIYLSIDKMSIEDLAFYVEMKKKKNKKDELKRLKNEAKNKAIKRLKSNKNNENIEDEDDDLPF